PSDEMPTIAAKLRRVLNADQLPVPVELPQAVEANEPLPCLTLEPVSLFGNPSLPAALVHFEYAGQQQAPRYDPASRLHDEPQQIGDQLVQINRDMAQEDQYLAQLREVGLKLHSQVNDHAFAWLPEPRQVPGLIAFWEDFLARQIPALEQRGWRVQFDDSVHPNISNVEFEFDISDESSHWFELGLSLPLSDGRELNTTDVVAQWLKQGSPDELIIPDEGEWLRIDTRALNTVQDLITELYNRKQLNKPARLAAFQIAQLQDIPDLDYRAAPMTQQLLQQLRDFNGIEAVPLSPQMQATLRPYQQDGLNWLAFLHRYHLGGILADDMGLGKTLQALALLQHIKDQGQLDTPALILAPTSLTGNWMHEAARFAPHLKVTLIHGPDRASAFAHIARSDVVITTYPLLPRDIEHYKDIHFSVLILDEAQAIKNPTTKISVQARRVNARTRLCLTGTPLENHLGELWSLMDFALPGLLAGRKTFQQQFRTPIEKHADAEQQKLLARRVAPFMLRRRKSEVVKELPPKTEIVQYVELAGKQRALYESIRVSMEKRIRDLVAQQGMQRSHIQFLDALLKLRQACIDPRLVKLEKAAAIREHAKMDWLTDNLPQLLEEGRRVLIFSQFTELLALIEQELTALDISYCKLTGQTRKRQEQIDRFQRGEASVFLISLKAGGSGLNLTTADVVIHMDPWWNPAVENQATDRAHRIGQDKPVFVYKLVAADTVEERIQQMQQKKQTLADRLFDDAVASSVPLDQDALLSLLSGKNGDGGNT
ncbi:MAG: DEAD/DEAH box helicase, partial [Pseudohongiella sp.]